MFTFSGPQDLLDTVRKMGEDAEKASRDERHLKRDQLAARVRAATLAHVHALLADYFAARAEGQS